MLVPDERKRNFLSRFQGSNAAIAKQLETTKNAIETAVNDVQVNLKTDVTAFRDEVKEGIAAASEKIISNMPADVKQSITIQSEKIVELSNSLKSVEDILSNIKNNVDGYESKLSSIDNSTSSLSSKSDAIIALIKAHVSDNFDVSKIPRDIIINTIFPFYRCLNSLEDKLIAKDFTGFNAKDMPKSCENQTYPEVTSQLDTIKKRLLEMKKGTSEVERLACLLLIDHLRKDFIYIFVENLGNGTQQNPAAQTLQS